MAPAPTTFWDDLAEDLRDPEFLRAYITESVKTETVDRLVNELDEARAALKMSKAELARSVSAEPAAVRRLLSAARGNPTVGTVVQIAAALGLRLELVPMPAEERGLLADPLRSGVAHDRRELAEAVEGKRGKPVSV